MLTFDEMYERMANGWYAGLPFTVCGNGSLPKATRNARKILPEWTHKYGCKVVCDAGAGDMKWRIDMDWPVDYRPFDLIPREPEVQALDITVDRLPTCDLILCRMVLNHLDDERIDMALGLFRSAGTYLAATQFPAGSVKRYRQFTRLDLVPRLGEPLESVPDGNEDGCRLALWRL